VWATRADRSESMWNSGLPAGIASDAAPPRCSSIFLVIGCAVSHFEILFCMHVISRKTLRQFWEQHPDSERALSDGSKSQGTTLRALRPACHLPTADKVGDFLVFNIMATIPTHHRYPFQPTQGLHPPSVDPPEYDRGA
jgi:hypothetical protein